MNNRNTETAGIPVNALAHKQYLQCKHCSKRFVAVNGRIQEEGLEENPFKQPAEAESENFFNRFKKLAIRCPECGSRRQALCSVR